MPHRHKPPSSTVSDDTQTDLPRLKPSQAGGGEPPALPDVLADCRRRVEQAGLSPLAALKALAATFAADLFSDADSVSIVVNQSHLGHSVIRLSSSRRA